MLTATFRGVQRRRQYFPVVPEQDANVLEVLIGKMGKDRDVDAVPRKCAGVLGQAEPCEPIVLLPVSRSARRLPRPFNASIRDLVQRHGQQSPSFDHAIDRRDNDKSQHGGRCHPSDHRHCDTLHHFRTGAGAPHNRQQSGHDRLRVAAQIARKADVDGVSFASFHRRSDSFSAEGSGDHILHV